MGSGLRDQSRFNGLASGGKAAEAAKDSDGSDTGLKPGVNETCVKFRGKPLEAARPVHYEWSMSAVMIKGHYDGKHVCLDEPVDLPPNTPVWVVVAQPQARSEEDEEWYAFAKAALARAYDDDEPDYSDAVIQERPSE